MGQLSITSEVSEVEQDIVKQIISSKVKGFIEFKIDSFLQK